MILITGINGFVAGHLAKKLLEEGFEVVGTMRDFRPSAALFLLNIEDVDLALGDITDRRFVERVVADYDVKVICHLAAQSIVRRAISNPLETYLTNVIGTVNILEAARRHDCIVLYTSTDKVYGNSSSLPCREFYSLKGMGIYENSKACADLICQAYANTYGLKVIITRACNIYGEADTNPRIIPNTIRSCMEGKNPVIYKGVSYKREYIYVGDVVDAYVKLISSPFYDVFNIGSGEVADQETIVKLILAHFPNLEPEYREPEFYMSKEIGDQCLDSSKIYEYLGWKAKVKLKEGIERTVNWWKSYGKMFEGL